MDTSQDKSENPKLEGTDRGVIVWFTGLSGAGKSTIADALAPKLRGLGKRVEVLDGDVVRMHLSKGLGFSKEDRDTNIHRIGFVAHLLQRNGTVVITAAISPYRSTRDWVRELAGDFVEVFVDAPLEVCEGRDVKGLYKKARAGEIKQFTGISDPYEEPLSPEITVRTHEKSLDECVDHIVARLAELSFVKKGSLRMTTTLTSQGSSSIRVEPESVPRFSDQADVDEFVSVLEKFERGELSPDGWRKFRLVRGTYGQRQEGVQMQRVKIPLGYMIADQVRAIADVADKFARGKAHLTTRQNFQFHFVALADIAELQTRLVEAGITSREACGNAVRNVTSCDLAGIAKTQAFDVRPHGETITRFFLRHPKAADLPRKFKIALSCCPHDCAQAAIHDVGLVAKMKDGKRGFKVYVGGGLSTSPEAAAVLYDFLPEEQIVELTEAVLLVFDARGNRINKHRARLKYVLRDLGLEKLREVIEVERAKIRERGDAPPVFTATPFSPPPPRARETKVGEAAPGYLAWRASNVKEQAQDGYAAVYVRFPLGDLVSDELRTVASLAERFGDGSVSTSAEQNLVLRFVPLGDLRALHAELARAGLARDGVGGLRDITSCPGADSCNLAVTTSRGLGRAIEVALDEALAAGGPRADAIAGASDALIKISGCPHSCGRHHIADLGFHGAARKIGGKAMPVYQLHLGGGVDAHGARFGAQVVKIPAKRVPAAVLRFLDLFAAQKREGERFGDYLRRLTPDDVKAATKDLADIDPAVAKADEYIDFDAQNGFVVETKEGECAA
jgi:adenylyl-sulfate kinase